MTRNRTPRMTVRTPPGEVEVYGTNCDVRFILKSGVEIVIGFNHGEDSIQISMEESVGRSMVVEPHVSNRVTIGTVKDSLKRQAR